MLDRKEIIQEIEKVKETVIGVQGELKTLKNWVHAHKSSTSKYHQEQKKLEQKLKSKQQKLSKAEEEDKQVAEDRKQASQKLDEIIDKIKQYKEICDNSHRIDTAGRAYLIQKANQLLFDKVDEKKIKKLGKILI